MLPSLKKNLKALAIFILKPQIKILQLPCLRKSLLLKSTDLSC